MLKTFRSAIILCVSILVITGTAFAETGHSSQANILQSDWNVGGTLGLEHLGGTPSADSKTRFNLSLNLKYFVIDHLALGLITNVTTNYQDSSDTVSSIGPAATYFLCTHDQFATYVSGSARFGLSDATLVSILEAAVGIEYFFTPSVALGPQFYFEHDTSHHSNYDRNNYGLEFNFGIYL